MKKFIVIALVALAPVLSFAQNAFSRFDDVEGIETVTINKEMFDMLGSVKTDKSDDDAMKYVGMAKDLDQLKVYTTKDKKLGKELREAITVYLKANPLQELMSVNDDGTKVKIYARQGSDPALVKECLIFVEDRGDREVVLVSFTGNINLNDLQNFK